jgi:hypothetical protein
MPEIPHSLHSFGMTSEGGFGAFVVDFLGGSNVCEVYHEGKEKR